MPLLGKYYSNFFYFISVFIIAAIFDPSKTSGYANDRIITADYYWGGHGLRSSKPTCDLPMMRILCSNKCRKDYICKNNECICKEQNIPLKNSLRSLDDYRFYQDNQYMYSKEFDMPEALRTAIAEDTKLDNTKPEDKKYQIEHQALRHHIAHFCPDLDKARSCIYKCMKVGKPAFCGKDHVCYCGHSYNNNDGKAEVIDGYSQYRDIYKMYFGPQTFD